MGDQQQDDVTTGPVMTAEQARSALERGSADGARVARRGRWVRTYLTVFAVGAVALELATGLGTAALGPVAVVPVLAAWLVLVVVMVTWANRQRAVLAGTGRRLGWAFGLWGALHGVALAVGLGARTGLGYWLPASLVVAAPLAVAAWLPWRERSSR